MIDVIIPAYNAYETIGKTLSSIAFQDCIDINTVYIVNDCSNKNYTEFVDFYSNFFDVVELKTNENCGPGLSRQFGIDNSSAEYIIFIDSDDIFSDNFAISKLYKAIVDTNSDIAVSRFFEEKDFGFLVHDISYVWMHGKMYKRSFLNKMNIRFNNSRENEDCGFNHLCYLCGASYVEVDGISYIWRNNPSSITRVNDGIDFRKKIKSFTFNIMWSMDEALKRTAHKERFADIAYGTLVSCYHYFLQDEEVFEKDDIFKQICKLVKYIDECHIDESHKALIIKNQLLADVSGPDLYKVYNPRITLAEFLNMLKIKSGDIK